MCCALWLCSPETSKPTSRDPLERATCQIQFPQHGGCFPCLGPSSQPRASPKSAPGRIGGGRGRSSRTQRHPLLLSERAQCEVASPHWAASGAEEKHAAVCVGPASRSPGLSSPPIPAGAQRRGLPCADPTAADGGGTLTPAGRSRSSGTTEGQPGTPSPCPTAAFRGRARDSWEGEGREAQRRAESCCSRVRPEFGLLWK